MKIVILDGYTENPGDLSWAGLEALGELEVYARTTGGSAEVIARIGEAEVVYTNKTPVPRAVFEACPNLRFLGVLATGYNVVDTVAAKAHGVVVSNIPTYGTASVAQFAIALLLEVCHHIGHHSWQVTREGAWSRSPDWCFWDYPLIELAGKTMGIIGLGHIGQATARIAGALGMEVLATGSRPCDAGRAVASYVTLETLLERSDVVVLHCPLLPETEGIINRQRIAQMRDGVILINNARGQLVVEQDLADALNSGKVAAAGLDVVSTEPIREDNPLLTAKNCLITPHISWAPQKARERIMATAEENLRQFLAGTPVHVVNP